MPKFTSEYAYGPLKKYLGNTKYIEDYYFIPAVKISFVGVTYSGKTQAIRTLVETFGGILQEISNSNNRTQLDQNYIFAEHLVEGKKQTVRVELKSFSEHAPEHNRYHSCVPLENRVLFFKHLDSSSFTSQLSVLKRNILRSHDSSFDQSSYPAVITRAKSYSDMTPRRQNQFGKMNFPRVYLVDNPKRKKYSVDNIDPSTVDIVVDTLQLIDKSYRLISFSGSPIPQTLDGKVVPYVDQLKLGVLDVVKEIRAKNSPEQKLLDAIFGKKDIVF